jgi:hypothetical protein
MFRNKTLITVIGFLLAGIGLLAIVLSIVGVNFSFLGWLESLGGVVAFLVKIALAVFGFILIYLGQTNWEQEDL